MSNVAFTYLLAFYVLLSRKDANSCWRAANRETEQNVRTYCTPWRSVLAPHSRQVGSTEIREVLDSWVTGEIAYNIDRFVIPVVGTGSDDWLLIMAITSVIMIATHVMLKPQPRQALIQIIVI